MSQDVCFQGTLSWEAMEDVLLQDEVIKGRERHNLQETGVWAQQIGKGNPRMKVK